MARTPRPKKAATTVYLTAEQRDRLRRLHDRTLVPEAEYVRQGVDMMLARYEGTEAKAAG